MEGTPEKVLGEQPMTYCIVPRDLAPRVHDALRRHFRDTPTVEVVVEHRVADRRAGDERRATAGEPEAGDEQRRIQSVEGRRVVDRRARPVPAAVPSLPARLQAAAPRLRFVTRREPSRLLTEDADTARLVARLQAGDEEQFSTLYLRYFDRVYAYLRVALRDGHEAEDVTQQVFMKVMTALPRYERRPGRPFRAWLFTIVRNEAITHLRKSGRLDVCEPRRMAHDLTDDREPPLTGGLDWICDRELGLFVERLPLAQRQVLVLKFMLDLSSAEIGQVLGRSADDVRGLQARALRYLEQRLSAIRRGPVGGRAAPMLRVPRHAPVLRLRRFALH
jgi:RNA polymerase sigma-70 factor (ECF subfamily)